MNVVREKNKAACIVPERVTKAGRTREFKDR